VLNRGVLYLVVSSASAPEDVPELVGLCQAAGWRVAVFSTPLGVMFIDCAELERQTGTPGPLGVPAAWHRGPVPPANAVLACPLTFNSANKFAHGHADNFAVSLLCEMAGYSVPIIAVPRCKPQLATRLRRQHRDAAGHGSPSPVRRRRPGRAADAPMERSNRRATDRSSREVAHRGKADALAKWHAWYQGA
jgi:hypothetical protein